MESFIAGGCQCHRPVAYWLVAANTNGPSLGTGRTGAGVNLVGTDPLFGTDPLVGTDPLTGMDAFGYSGGGGRGRALGRKTAARLFATSVFSDRPVGCSARSEHPCRATGV